MRIDVALNPAEIALLPQRDLSKTVCVVFDILRATSSMVTALAHGVSEIYPVTTVDDAFVLRDSLSGALLGGERDGEKLPGFDFGNSPFEYRESPGAKIVWTSTNGTIALRACDGAHRVLVGALLNLDAVAAELRKSAMEEVLLVGAGTQDTLALEDVLGTGYLIQRLAGADLTDSARTALALADSFPAPLDALRIARNGRALLAKGRDVEVEWCSQVSLYTVVGFMDGPVVRPVP